MVQRYVLVLPYLLHLKRVVDKSRKTLKEQKYIDLPMSNPSHRLGILFYTTHLLLNNANSTECTQKHAREHSLRHT